MLTSVLGRAVEACVHFSCRRPRTIIALALLVTGVSATYAIRNFAIDTDVNHLIDSRAPWAVRDSALDAAFPARNQLTLVVVTAPAAELATRAADDLAQRLAASHDVIASVVPLNGGPFFERNALLYASTGDLDAIATRVHDARPLISAIARDPSLRGLANLLAVSMAEPLETGQFSLADAAPLFDQSASTLEAVVAGRDAALSWRHLFPGASAVGSYALIAVHPRPDYGALEAGSAASDRIRAAAREAQIAQTYHASVQLTGPIPLGDEEFASIADGAGVNALLTVAVVIALLWLALRSFKLVAAVFVTLACGLLVTAALGLVLVGKLNMISVAFAVLFVGIGVDFSIQFGVRLRTERAQLADLGAALGATARSIGVPLALAALATAASFFAFLPTAYRGLAELGEIAGSGILLVAFPSALTVFPALVMLMAPTRQSKVPGTPALAPLDRLFTERRRTWLALAAITIAGGALFLPRLDFDADPLHLKDARSESMRTLAMLKDDPDAGVDDVQVLARDESDARTSAERIRSIPEVARVVTLFDLIPDDQDAKRTRIRALAAMLSPILDAARSPAASDRARVAALRNAAAALDNAALDHPGDGAASAERLAHALDALARGPEDLRERAEFALGAPLRADFEEFGRALSPDTVTLDSLPESLRDQWVGAHGELLIEISPHINPTSRSTDPHALARFCAAVLQVDPRAAGGPISVLGSADAIINSFWQAAGWTLLSVTLILWFTLGRFADVVRTLLPLLVSALVTLEVCAIFQIRLNFANIIALPLLLGIGVAFKIYYVIAWRRGQSGFLQSGLTQAVVLSAGTTATAFGSLWLSHHAGTASMGELLALSLASTLVGAVLFQPILMGAPPAKTARD